MNQIMSADFDEKAKCLELDSHQIGSPTEAEHIKVMSGESAWTKNKWSELNASVKQQLLHRLCESQKSEKMVFETPKKKKFL